MTGRSRPGYTLLEVLLAMAISLLLLGALYVAMDMQLRLAQDGRDKVEESQLARALLARIVGDVSSGVRPALPPVSGGGQSGAGGGGTAAAGGGANGNAAAAAGQAGAAGGGSSSSSSGGAAQGNGSPMLLLSSVQGDGATLNLITTRVPRELLLNLNAGGQLAGVDPTSGLPTISDQRVVSYWLAGGSDSPLGLARRDLPIMTSDDAQNLPPGLPDEGSFVIAPEVRSLSFRYFDPQTGDYLSDGGSWPDDATGFDGNTPFGPPPAIEITIGIASATHGKRAKEKIRTYTQVVYIPTANGTPQTITGSSNGSSP